MAAKVPITPLRRKQPAVRGARAKGGVEIGEIGFDRMHGDFLTVSGAEWQFFREGGGRVL